MSQRPSPAALLHYAKLEAFDVQSVQTSPDVAHVVTGIVATGLWQCHSCRCSYTRAWPAPVCAQCSSKVDTRKTVVRPCYSIVAGPALVECSGATCCRPTRLALSQSHGADVPDKRPASTGIGPLTPTPDSVVHPQADRATYTMPHRRRPSICCRWNNLPLVVRFLWTPSWTISRYISSSHHAAADV